MTSPMAPPPANASNILRTCRITFFILCYVLSIDTKVEIKFWSLLFRWEFINFGVVLLTDNFQKTEYGNKRMENDKGVQ